MIDKDKLKSMSELQIADIDTASLVDIDSAPVDTSLPMEDRFGAFLEQIKNPYCFICDDTPVRIRYVSDEKTLVKSLGDYFIKLKR